MEAIATKPPQSVQTGSVFVSYSRTNHAACVALRAALEQAGLQAFQEDDAMRVGERWLERLQNALQACAAFIVELSPAKIAGATYFFTVNLAERSSNLLTEQVDALRAAFRSVKSELPFRTNAIVVLPDHLHAIWTLPIGDADFSIRWQRIKAAFSCSLEMGERRSASRIREGERGSWQRRFWEHVIRDESDYAAHVDYIHYNPVKHGYVKAVAQWAHSSFHAYCRRGLYTLGWAGTGEDEERFGERE